MILALTPVSYSKPRHIFKSKTQYCFAICNSKSWIGVDSFLKEFLEESDSFRREVTIRKLLRNKLSYIYEYI